MKAACAAGTCITEKILNMTVTEQAGRVYLDNLSIKKTICLDVRPDQIHIALEKLCWDSV